MLLSLWTEYFKSFGIYTFGILKLASQINKTENINFLRITHIFKIYIYSFNYLIYTQVYDMLRYPSLDYSYSQNEQKLSNTFVKINLILQTSLL